MVALYPNTIWYAAAFDRVHWVASPDIRTAGIAEGPSEPNPRATPTSKPTPGTTAREAIPTNPNTGLASQAAQPRDIAPPLSAGSGRSISQLPTYVAVGAETPLEIGAVTPTPSAVAGSSASGTPQNRAASRTADRATPQRVAVHPRPPTRSPAETATPSRAEIATAAPTPVRSPAVRPKPTVAEARAPAIVSAASSQTSSAAPAEPNRVRLTPENRTTAPTKKTEDTRTPVSAPIRRAASSTPPQDVERIDHRGLPDVSVVRTSWHPDASRRSTRIRLEDTRELVTLRQGDAVGGLVVQEISPSAVIFAAGEIEIRRRVGQGR